jgi:hypothetical protein
MQDTPKFTRIRIFGLKNHHLATLHGMTASVPLALERFRRRTEIAAM